MATIRADVGQMQSIASWLRTQSSEFAAKSAKVGTQVMSLEWEGKAYNRFQDNYRQTDEELKRFTQHMNAFAATLDSIAEALRQADLETARREEEAKKEQNKQA